MSIKTILQKLVVQNDGRQTFFNRLNFRLLGIGAVVTEPYIVKNPEYITIGKNFSSLYNLRLEAITEYQGQKFNPEIIIGDNVCFNSDVHIGCIDRIVIGNNVLMASRIFIADSSHGEITNIALELPPLKRPLYSNGPVIIEDNVWIGVGVAILSGVTIGKNSIIGANAVVTKDIPPNCVAGGVPCKILKKI